MARYREAGVGIEGGGEMRDYDDLSQDRKRILEKLMDRDEEEPEVGFCFVCLSASAFGLKETLCHTIYLIITLIVSHQDIYCSLL